MIFHRFRCRHTLLLRLSVLLLLGSTPVFAHAQTQARCFAETGQCISGRLRDFWEQNGGLLVFGFPTSPQRTERVEERTVAVQWFERARLELHPETGAPYDVLLGRLGADLLTQQGLEWPRFPTSTPWNGCRYFAETQHNICGPFLDRWRATGLDLDGTALRSDAESLALWGLPLSDAYVATLGDGTVRTIQWFERGRLEFHPEHTPPYSVLGGLLGEELRGAISPMPAPDARVADLIEHVNQYRSSANCAALFLDAQLSTAAQRHSEDMARSDFFSHTGSDGSESWNRVAAAGYPYVAVAENLAGGSPSPEMVVDGWTTADDANDGHRRTLQTCAFTDIGIGFTARQPDPGAVRLGFYWTADFGRRQ